MQALGSLRGLAFKRIPLAFPSSASSTSPLSVHPACQLGLRTFDPSCYFTRGYHERVVDHYENPRNVGSLDKNDPNVGTGLVGAPACGDVMKLMLKFDDDGKIVDAKFKTFGCGSAIASSSYATEHVKGMTKDQASALKNKDIAEHLKLPPVKIHCSMLAEDAIKAAVADFEKKQAAIKKA